VPQQGYNLEVLNEVLVIEIVNAEREQADRNVACIAEVFHRANIPPRSSIQIGFYVLAPKSQIEQGRFSKVMKHSSIQGKVKRRVQEYGGEKDEWYSE
jgi:hypothetical protein